MKLVILNSGPDTAGCGISLKRAFDRYASEWNARAICRRIVYLEYPTDIYWPRESPSALNRQVNQLVRNADVIHVMDSEQALRWFRLRPQQTIVVHHLGSHYRRQPRAVSARCQAYGATEVTDSLDLLYPHVGWLPIAADLEELARLREERYRPSKRIRIAHAPTRRALKATGAIVQAIRSLSTRYPIDFDLIEGVSNRECLERKATADIFVDQLLLGFGVNNIECWAMGISVVSGIRDSEAKRKALEMWDGVLPWADATEATLEAVIEHLVTDEGWRAQLGERGLAHAQRWHSQESVVEQALAIYSGAGVEAVA